MAANAPWVVTAAGLTLAVRLTPRSSRDAIDGIETLSDGRVVLKVFVRAPPSEGEANDALVRLLAKTVGVPKRAVALVAGTTARIKRITIAGNSPTLIAALEKVVKVG